MKNKKQNITGFSLIEILIVIAISVSALAYVINKNSDANYHNEADNHGKLIVRLAHNISDAMIYENNCQGLDNTYVVEKGLLPEGFAVDRDITPYGISYKYGEIVIDTNLSTSLLPIANFGPNDAFGIYLTQYKTENATRFIDPLLEHFDAIIWGSFQIKSENGINESKYRKAIHSNPIKTGIRFIVWGC